ncbi:kinesin-like protein KIF2A isoform X1 [Callorhinchus milii]|uniref:Kinesin-like protein n=2 Tax=Callorhinchus milii TaxID=7868 RepID=V9KCH0_CALMI|nr:kinesin-like protein KIF2A isoform X1 [Callorhinchus milii]|eukprot:gi/632963712/ref/XP_007898038.1/ PREDICTED: kinesin-like protein KIF2C isoform X1 [Callorhinchus milii]
MAAVNPRVQVGIVVKIQRSDGMVHEANITAVSPDQSKVKAEWLENNLQKGKEIDFDTLLLLNPELSEEIMPPPSKPVMMTRASSRRVTTAQRITHPSEIPRPNRSRASTVLQTQKEADAELSNSNVSARRATISTARKTKESEKLKKQQDRRMQLQEIREKRTQEYDTSNPNWEFMKMIKEFRATLDYRPLSVADPVEVHKICVCVRKRPLSKMEKTKKEVDVITLPSKNVVLVHEPKLKVDLTKYLENQSFRFDYAFNENVNNEEVYRLSAGPLVQTIFERGMATCFAYGQTGSGKTHTMGGDFSGKTQDFSKGIYALATQDVFLLLQQPRYKDLNLTVFVTFFEIYSGKVFDLLNKKAKLRILEDNKQQVQIVGLQEQEVFSVDDVILMIDVGNSHRTSGQTSVNNNSSRSHAVFQIILRRHKKLHGQFSLIDLAGNERGADTSSADRQTRMEGAEINKSLLALKECIRALGHNNIYTPFRASKLTLVLRDSFIGENSRTCMIAMISPGLNSCEHTLNTLRYSDRVKELGVEEGASCEPEISNTSKDINENETMEQSEIRLLYQKNPAETEVLSENQEMVETYDRFGLDVPQEEPSLICDMHLDVSRVLELEEQILDEHRAIQQKLIQWSNADDELLKMTQLPDYNIEIYTNLLQTNMDERLLIFQEFNKNLIAFRQALQKEEQAAQTIQ